MNSSSLSEQIRILYILPYYEKDLTQIFGRLINDEKYFEYKLFTINENFVTNDLNSLLSTARTIVNKENIDLVLSDSCIGQIIIAKLSDEYPKICNGRMHYLDTFKCINRYFNHDVFGINECISTISIDLSIDWKINSKYIEDFLSNHKYEGYIKSVYSFDYQLSSFRITNYENGHNIQTNYFEIYKQQFESKLRSFLQIYISPQNKSSVLKPSLLVQQFYDLATHPHWRLIIANSCIFDKEIIMWPLVDGYCGWPFLAQKPLAIMPIIVCPSRQITNEQQSLIYIRFRQNLTRLIENYNLRYGWIQCSYFISCTNEIRLVSIKPTYSIHLIEAFSVTNKHGNPISALIQLSKRQRPETPILNGKTVYIHRLWANVQEECSISDLINTKEIKRIQRSKTYLNRYVRLRFHDDDTINETKTNGCIFNEIGFIQVQGDYYESGLRNLIEFRYSLLKKPDLFPFSHHSMLLFNQYQFDPVTCLPSNELIEKLDNYRNEEYRDLI